VTDTALGIERLLDINRLVYSVWFARLLVSAPQIRNRVSVRREAGQA